MFCGMPRSLKSTEGKMSEKAFLSIVPALYLKTMYPVRQRVAEGSELVCV